MKLIEQAPAPPPWTWRFTCEKCSSIGEAAEADLKIFTDRDPDRAFYGGAYRHFLVRCPACQAHVLVPDSALTEGLRSRLAARR